MNALASWLDSTASFELAAFFVSWVAVALLVVVVAGLHVRLGRLEALLADPTRPVAFSGVRGRDLGPLLAEPLPRLVLVVSSSCDSCRSLLADLAAQAWPTPTVVAWKGAVPPELPLPPAVRSSDGGNVIAAALGVGTVPFAVVLDGSGRVVDAVATGSLSTLQALLASGVAGGSRQLTLQEVER